MSAPRAQTAINVGVCSHAVTEPVAKYSGEPIAYRCKSCTLITATHGACDGCGAVGKLPHHTKRYHACSEGCLKARATRDRKAAAEKLRAAAR